MDLLPPDALPDAPPAEAAKRLSWKGLAWPVALSVAVLAVIFYVTYEPDAFAEMARTLNPGLLALAFGGVGVQMLLGGGRLRYISGGKLDLVHGVRGALSWDFMSAVTPSAVGGAPFAAYFVAKDNNLPVGEATALMLFSMLMDQIWFAVSIPLIFLASAYTDVFPPAIGAIGAGTLTVFFVGLMVWAGFFAYATLIRPQILETVATKIVRLRWLRRFEGRARRELVQLRRQAATLRGQPPRFFVYGFLWSAGIWLTRYVVLLLIVLAVFPAVDVFTFLVRTGAMMLTAMAVPTPGGSGGIEGLYVLFLAPLMPGAVVGPTVLVWRLLSYHFILGAGLVLTAHAVNRRLRRRSAGAPRNASTPNGVEAASPTPRPHAEP